MRLWSFISMVFVVMFMLVGCAGQQGGKSPLAAGDNLISVRLAGVMEYETAEVFGKVLRAADGVRAARRVQSRIVPDNPQAGMVLWRVEIDNTKPFSLETRIMEMVGQVLDASGKIRINGTDFSYSSADIQMLKGLRPMSASSRELSFIIDRELVRDREMSGR